VRKLNRLTEVFALATLVLLGHPDTAGAQTLTFNPSSVTANISGPGGTFGPTQVTVSSSTAISSLVVAAINTTDRTNWLCATVTGTNTINVSVGTGTCSGLSTTQLATNGTYTGDITVTANGGSTSHLTVTLTVGNTGAGGNGVVANPSQLTFSTTSGGSVASQNVFVTVNRHHHQWLQLYTQLGYFFYQHHA
jgi:hypothetical protein